MIRERYKIIKMNKGKICGALLFLSHLLTGQDTLQLLFERETSYQHFSGNALIIDSYGDTMLFSGGYSDAKQQAPIRPDHVFDIGSISKQFTAAAILTLVKEGKIDLHTPINEYLPKSSSKRWKKVTIHHLLTHSSGIPSLFQYGQGMDDIFPTKDPISIDSLIGFFRDKKLNFKPGNDYQYSNSGYVELAKIIENISGKDFGVFMNQEVFDRYGLKNTQFGPPSDTLTQPLVGYTQSLTGSAPSIHSSWTTGAGGVHSTISDLAKWVRIIQSEPFLSKELRELYLHPHQSKFGGHYGYGWEHTSREGAKIVQHDGATFGYISYLGFNPNGKELIILLTNQSHVSIEMIGKSSEYIKELSDKAWDVLHGKSIELLPEISHTEFTGTQTFQFENGYELTFQNKGDDLKVLGTDLYPPTRLGIHQPFNERGEKADCLRTISEMSWQKKFRKMSYCYDKEMRFVIKSGLFSIGFNMVTKHMGDLTGAKPFELTDRTGRFRLYGTDGTMDMVIYFNDEGLVQGIFEDGDVSDIQVKEMPIYPLGSNTFYLDGFPYGEHSAEIEVIDEGVVFKQFGREFKGRRR